MEIITYSNNNTIPNKREYVRYNMQLEQLIRPEIKGIIQKQEDTHNIILLSTDTHFYKTFNYSNTFISVYLNVADIREYITVLVLNKNSYFIKKFCLDKIDNLEQFKSMFLQYINKNISINTVEQLSKENVKTFVRDYKQDIVYNPFNNFTKNKNFPLFYIKDTFNNVCYAYNRQIIDQETIKLFNGSFIDGCLIFLFNIGTNKQKREILKEERELIYLLDDLTWYTDNKLLQTQGF